MFLIFVKTVNFHIPQRITSEIVFQVKWTTYFAYGRALGVFMMLLLLALFLLFGVSSVLSNLWLTQWTEDPVLQNASLTNTSTYLEHRDLYVGVYGGFGVAQGIQ